MSRWQIPTEWMYAKDRRSYSSSTISTTFSLNTVAGPKAHLVHVELDLQHGHDLLELGVVP